jgi:hypothetical protein
MARYTVQTAAGQARRFPGLDVHAVIDCGGGAGFLLTTRGDSGGVLGIGAIDVIGEHAAVGCDREEAAALRDALTAWLEEN